MRGKNPYFLASLLSLTISFQPRSRPFFFFTVRAYLNTHKYGLCCSLLGPRQNNFCHSDNYLLFFPSPIFGSQILGITWPAATRVFSRSKGENPGYEAVELDLNVGNDEYISLCNFGDRDMNGFEVTEGSFQSLPSRPVIEIIIKKSPVWIKG